MISKLKIYLKNLTGEDWTIQATENKDFGDYASNLAFRLSKTYGKPPIAVAQELAEKVIAGDKEGFFSKVEAAAPGFVNFYLSPDALHAEMEEILKRKNEYGKVALRRAQGLKVNVEFISANPTGPLTMANGRGGFYGDVLSNVLEAVGHKVTREYYVNDAGNQVRLLGESILAAEGKIPEKEEYYKGEYIKWLVGKTSKQAVAVLLKSIKYSLKKANISYDVWFSEEKNLHKKGELKKTLEFLKSRGMVEEKDGAMWLKPAEEGGVLIKSDGTPTYFLSDLAYHFDKLIKRKFDLAIDVWGADHHGYAERMKRGIAALGLEPSRLKIVITQLVRLVRGGVEVKMSKRAGEFITMDDLLAEVGKDAARFFFLMHAPETHMDFDLDLAKEQSSKNPVYYAQYAYVRAASILKKEKKQKRKKANAAELKQESELRLLKTMAEFPDIILQTAADYQVNRLTTYTMELARQFHNFYEKEHVIGEDKDLERARLALVLAAKIVFENLFGLLGISMPEKM